MSTLRELSRACYLGPLERRGHHTLPTEPREQSKARKARRAASEMNVSWCGGVGESQGRAQLVLGGPDSLKLRAAVTWTTAGIEVAGKATDTATSSRSLRSSRRQAVGTKDRRARGGHREDTQPHACPAHLAWPAPGETLWGTG